MKASDIRYAKYNEKEQKQQIKNEEKNWKQEQIIKIIKSKEIRNLKGLSLEFTSRFK